MNILVDTSALYAVVDTSNEAHPRASATWRRILDEGDLILISSYALSETITLLHARFGTATVRTFVDGLLPIIVIDWVDQETHDAALGMMLETEGKSGPSLTDCANMETMRRQRIHTIFAYDKHYERPGIAVVGG